MVCASAGKRCISQAVARALVAAVFMPAFHRCLNKGRWTPERGHKDRGYASAEKGFESCNACIEQACSMEQA